MFNPTQHPIDIELWRRRGSASREEWWKWNWELWQPVLDMFFSGEKRIEDIECPVCHQRTLYVSYQVANMRYSEEEGRVIYSRAEVWMGCHGCETQLRFWGELPRWVRDEDVVWATERHKQTAEKELAEYMRRKEQPHEDVGS